MKTTVECLKCGRVHVLPSGPGGSLPDTLIECRCGSYFAGRGGGWRAKQKLARAHLPEQVNRLGPDWFGPIGPRYTFGQGARS